MYFGEIKNCDIADGPGVRITLFVSGCRNRCPGCFQPQTWAFDYGRPFDRAAEDEVLRLLAPAYIRGLTILGGEPFEPENQETLYPFLRRFRNQYPGKDLWMFSGYTLENMLREGAHPHTVWTLPILSLADVLVDGPFIQEQKDLLLRFRGSRNQRLLDVPASLQRGEPVLWTDGQDRGRA